MPTFTNLRTEAFDTPERMREISETLMELHKMQMELGEGGRIA